MNAKHTSGPWKVHRGDDYLQVYTETKPRKPSEVLESEIYQVRYPSEEDEANAALIAAAPEMLSALHWVLAKLPVQTSSGHFNCLRDAVAKAEGIK